MAIDAVLGRGVLLVVINDVASPETATWLNSYSHIQSVSVVGTHDALIVRSTGRFVWRIFQNHEKAIWEKVHTAYRRMIGEAVSHRCHKLTTEASAAFLLGLLKAARDGCADAQMKLHSQ